LREAFNGNDVIFNAYKWLHDEVIIIKLSAGTRNKIPYKRYMSDFSYVENWQNNIILLLISDTTLV